MVSSAVRTVDPKTATAPTRRIACATRTRYLPCMHRWSDLIQHTLRQALLALALLAAGTQAALPQGFMLERNTHNGALSVVFCAAGDGVETRWLDLATGETIDRDVNADRSTDLCTFAAAHTLAIDAVERLSLPPLRATVSTLHPVSDAARKSSYRANRRARAPPHLL